MVNLLFQLVMNIIISAVFKIEKLVKSLKFRHACEGRHPEPFEITGFLPSRA
jgi:hypothetical protein